LDYKWPGKKLKGAHNKEEDSLYFALWSQKPEKKYLLCIDTVPHWFKTIRKSEREYFVWNFLKACTTDMLPINIKADKWHSWVGIECIKGNKFSSNSSNQKEFRSALLTFKQNSIEQGLLRTLF
jgi:hypothetical protein